MSFLHGVETFELREGAVTVRVPRTAVIGLVGTAPKGPVNVMTVVRNAQDASQFGEQLPGFTIPQALSDILKQGGATVVVINVVDTTQNTNTAAVAAESFEIENRKGKLEFAPFGTLVITNEDEDVTYTANTDYTVDAFGNVTILAAVGTIAEGAILKATYRKFDESTVTNNQIIGTVSGSVKTGFKLFDNAFNQLGFKVRYYIAPEYSDVNAIAQEMIVVANKFRGRALIDAPLGTSVATAIAGRGPLGTINFNTSSKRAVLCFPRLKVDGAPDGATTRPYSQFLAGVIADTHRRLGYWFSPSNKEIIGVTGPELPLSFDYADPNTDCNALNEVGIVTVANTFGTGIRTWGNRSAAFPASTFPDNFIAVGDVQDICHEALELAMMQFLDRPINQAIIDDIRETVNGFFRTLIQRGAIVDGICTFDPAKNPPTEIAAGHLTFDLNFMPPTPAERITFESFLDINLLKTLR